jgi:hypothetical protein
MRKPLTVPIIVLAALAVLAGSAFAQAAKKPDIVGRWVGFAVVSEDGTQVEITMVIAKAEAGYSGKLSDSSGMVPEGELHEIVFKDNKLGFSFDLAQPEGTMLITISLTLENETLKGVWSNPDGNTGTIELTLQK